MKCTDVDLTTRCTQRNRATREQVCIKERKKNVRGRKHGYLKIAVGDNDETDMK